MAVNRLQAELERQRAAGAVNNLVDTNFHNAGFMPPRAVLERAFREYLDTRGYEPHPQGLLSAREAISAYYAAAGVPIGTEDLILTASTSEAYGLIFNRLTSPGDNVLLPAPGYPLFEYIAGFNHLECRYYRTRLDEGFGIRGDRIEAIMDERTRVIVLISPHNPTGHVATEAELDTLCRIAAERNALLLCDEVFESFLHTVPALPRPASRSVESGEPGLKPLVLTLNGVSKMFAAPDLKLGWIAVSGPEEPRGSVVEELAFANDMYLSCSTPAQTMLPHLFDGTGDFRQEMQKTIEEHRSALLEGLQRIPGIEVLEPEGGIHCVLRVPESPLDDEELALELLRQEQQYVHPGYFYRLEEERCLVLSFLPPAERLQEGARAIRRILQQTLGGTP
jgi:hypothetical protein